MASARRGGLVLSIGAELRFLPASVALRVAPQPRITAVPGGPAELVGIAVHEGAVVPVISVGDARHEMIVCQHAGELIGIVGGQVVESGTFDVAAGHPDLVEVAGARIRPLDVAQLYARVQSGARSGRWG
jgi:chemotaxis signal transduction protein